ncbi:hypothetical protein IPZ68_37600 [Streptomyces arenae]|nr:hypothetical protein [Streptomyces arenae]
MTPPPSTPRIATVTVTAVAALTLCLAGPALALDKPTEPGELTLVDTPKGKALADKDGNPLYTRDADKPDTPGCTGECATTWPAAIGYPTKADDVTGQTAQTEDNATDADQPQVIYETRPLYYFKDDEKGQDPKGQDVEGWSLLGADGEELGAGAANDATDESASPEASGEASASAEASPEASAEGSAEASPDASRSPSTNVSANSSAAPMPTAPSGGTSAGTGTDSGTGTGTDTGALKATPSGAARGGAPHATAAGEHPSSGPLAIASAAVTGAAAGAGIWLLRRRRERGTGAEHH